MNKDTFKIASIYIGTVIGAGFASGREIIDFFAVYGVKGILGMIISGFLFSFIGAFILSKVYEHNINSSGEMINFVFGDKLGFVVETIILFSLFIGFCIMLAGSGAIFEEQFGISKNIGISTMAILCFIIFLSGIKGFSIINSILVPILILGIVFLGSNVILKEGLMFSNFEGLDVTNKGNFITSSFLYVSFNSLLLIVVLSSLLPIIPNKNVAVSSGILGGIVLGILGCNILIPLLILYTQIYDFAIPMLKICEYESSKYVHIFSFVLWIAMFTTAIANGYSFIENVTKKKDKKFISFLFCLISIPLANLGFSELVATMYPIFGYLGGVILIFILISIVNKN